MSPDPQPHDAVRALWPYLKHHAYCERFPVVDGDCHCGLTRARRQVKDVAALSAEQTPLLFELRAMVMTVVSDPHLTWERARARLVEALNQSFQEPPGFEQCPECGNLAMNPLPSCATCGEAREINAVDPSAQLPGTLTTREKV